MLLAVIICSLAGGAISLIGGIVFISSKKSRKLADFATAFAAGALLAAAFLDLIPEALEDGDAHIISAYILVGLVFFFIIEGSVHWFHHHKHDDHSHEESPTVVPMLVLSDTIHNFIDGIAIAAGFLVSFETGVAVTLAVAAHEIPQEIGDFALMLKHGVPRRQIVIVNLVSALAATVGAVAFYLLGSAGDISMAPLLALLAGFFIYIATTDIMPSLHRDSNHAHIALKSLLLILGIVVVGAFSLFAH